ncbi:hypothetical protein [Paraburkholderia sediminicola]
MTNPSNLDDEARAELLCYLVWGRWSREHVRAVGCAPISAWSC